MLKKISVVCLLVYLCAMFSSCADFDESSKPLPTATTPTITRYSLKELKQNTIEVSEKTLADLDIVTEHDKFVLLNNKKDQFYPYKDGYIYPIEKGGKDGPNDMLVYDDRQGNITERGDLGCIEKIIGDSIYYTDGHGCLKCNENGNVISYDNDCWWGNVFFTEQFIYYIEVDYDNDKSCLYRVNYDGKDKQKLYEFGFCVSEMRLYRGKLWFTYDSDGKDRFGVLDLSTNQIGTYDKVRSNGYSLGTGIIINGKYIYYTDPNLKRLNIEDNSVEEVLNKNVVSMGFVDDKIICCTNSAIYLVSDKGAKHIKIPLMKDEFFSNITIEGKKVFVETQGGAFFWRVRQIDFEGNVIMKVYSSHSQIHSIEKSSKKSKQHKWKSGKVKDNKIKKELMDIVQCHIEVQNDRKNYKDTDIYTNRFVKNVIKNDKHNLFKNEFEVLQKPAGPYPNICYGTRRNTYDVTIMISENNRDTNSFEVVMIRLTSSGKYKIYNIYYDV